MKVEGPMCRISGQERKITFMMMFSSVYNHLKLKTVFFIPENESFISTQVEGPLSQSHVSTVAHNGQTQHPFFGIFS